MKTNETSIHSVDTQAAQGDVLFRRISAIPKTARQEQRNGRIVVAHSETGHHHAIDDSGVIRYTTDNPLVCYLQIAADTPHVDVVHHRSFDTHATVRLTGPMSCWEVRGQREFQPEGERRVTD